MPALSTLLATGDSAVGSWTTDSGGTTNLYLKIDEGIAVANDTTDYIKGPNDTNNSDYKCTMGATAADFITMSTLKFNIRYALSGTPPGSSKDTYGISIRIVNGATILAANDSGGTFQSVVSTTTMSTSFANSGAIGFNYINFTTSKATWDAAVVEIRQTYNQTGSKDAHAVLVSALELTGTYNTGMTTLAGVYTLTGNAIGMHMDRKMAAQVSSTVFTGNSIGMRTDRKMAAQVSSTVFTGNSIGMRTDKRMILGTCAITFTGYNIGLINSGDEDTVYFGVAKKWDGNAFVSTNMVFKIYKTGTFAAANGIPKGWDGIAWLPIQTS